MAEIYHEDLLEYLALEQQRINGAINAVNELVRNGDKYVAAAKNKMLADIRGAIGPVVGLGASNYAGNSRPPPPPPPSGP